MADSKVRLVFALIVIVTFTCCKSEGPKESSLDPVQLMADLHCEAVSFRKARFELADKMRFIEDTLIQPITTDSAKAILQQQLDDLIPYKDSVVNGGLDLAKIIKAKLDSLIEIEFITSEQRKAFDEQLTIELEKRGCK